MGQKGVIVAAGYGTRFLPVSRVVPKELLPILRRSCLQLVVEEMAEAGVDEILVITSRRKRAIEDLFDRDVELEQALAGRGRDADLAPPPVRATFVRQRRMGGTGDALLLAREFARHDPVVVAFPDDLFFGANATTTLLATGEQAGCSVLGALDVGDDDPSAYGVLEVEPGGPPFRVRRVVEKPPRAEAPSSLVSVGRFYYTPDFFEALERHARGHVGGEYYPMAAMAEVASRGRLAACALPGTRHDTGTPAGYLGAVLDAAWADGDLQPVVAAWAHRRGLSAAR